MLIHEHKGISSSLTNFEILNQVFSLFIGIYAECHNN